MRRRINYSPSHNPFPNSLFDQKLYNFSEKLKKNCPEVAQLLNRSLSSGTSFGIFILKHLIINQSEVHKEVFLN